MQSPSKYKWNSQKNYKNNSKIYIEAQKTLTNQSNINQEDNIP